MRADDEALRPGPVDARLAARLGELRVECGWSMDELARRSGVSRSTLSRLERGETSPTAVVLGRLCTVYERTMSQVLSEAESGPSPVVRAGEQPVWTDSATGFVRRSVSPPHPGLRGELVQGQLPAGAGIGYDRPPVAGLEHHVWVLEGRLEVTVEGTVHALTAGDCLRFRLWGSSRYACPGPEPVRYAIAVVLP